MHQNSPSVQHTDRTHLEDPESPKLQANHSSELEWDLSPTRAQFNTQRAQKLNDNFKAGGQRLTNQHTPETVRRNQAQHIRMSSNPQVIQFVQGGQDEEKKNSGNAQNLIMFDPDQPRELLTSEIDIVSRVDQFRSSTTSLQGVEQPNTHGYQVGLPNQAVDMKLTKQETKFKFPERAMPLITVNPSSNKFEVNVEAMEFLNHVRGPISVVSVAGMYRTGKSYLLNRVLLNRQGGFGVGPSIHPCTKGIHIWGSPVSGFSESGEPVNVLVVDSEGLGGLDEDNNHDMRIFSLALLISSFFIYNSMGQIDEAAISSLSLVVNLTKLIQTNALANQSPNGSSSSLESVLPNFLWVVRDFSLQLQDEKGNEITASQYLENALSQRSKDPNDPKNKIRHALQSYFKNRDCQTMVRPLVQEDRLQSLEELEIECLRPEFIEQVMSLRKKVLQRMPPKRVLGHAIDGKTWAGLLKSYVEQINSGNTPNIESSWHNICNSRAQQGLAQAIEQFQREMDQAVMPANVAEVEKLIVDAERTAIRDLKRELVGEDSFVQEIVAKFQQIVDTKSEEIKQYNEMACQEFSQQMLVQLFGEVEQVKHTIMEDPTVDAFQQVDFTLRELSNFYEQNCFEFPEKRLYLAEAKTQFMAEILNIQSRQLMDQQRIQQDIEVQMKDRLATQLREAREEARQEKEKIETQCKEYLLQKSELEASSQILREQLQHVKESKEKDDQENNDTILKLRTQLSGVIETSRSCKESFEDQIKEIQRSVKQSQSEFDKQKALMEQKISYLEQSLQEKSEKERESTNEWKTLKAEMAIEIKSATSKYEADIKLLTKQLEEEREKASDLELQHHEQTEKLESAETRFNEVVEGLKTQLRDQTSQLKELQTLQKNQLKQESEVMMSHRLKKSENDLKSQKTIIDELELKVKESFEAQMQVTHLSKKDIAMRDQQIEFLTMQLKESKEQLEETQRQHRQMVEALNKNNEASDEEQAQTRLELLQKEYNATTEAQMAQISDLTLQNEMLSRKQGDSEHQNRLALAELQHKLSEAKIMQDDLIHARNSLQEKLKLMENTRARVIEESEAQLAKLKKTFEKETQEREEQVTRDLEEFKEQSKQQHAQIKNFYEMEKQQLESRITEEKERANRRIQTIQDELNVKINEATREKDHEIEYLQDQLSALELHQQSLTAQVENELQLKQQTLDNLERQLAEAKDRLYNSENSKASSFERQIEHFETQRIELNSRIDRLQNESLEKDKQIASLTHKLDRIQDSLMRKTTDLDQAREQLDKEKTQITEKLEVTRNKLQEVQDESMQLKLESGRQQALLNQQVEFLNRKIEELQKTTEDQQRIFDERIKVCRQESFDEVQSQVERVTSEKELWESKYEQKRKALKDLENSLSRKNGDLERQNNLLKSQIQKIEHERDQAAQQAAEEIQYLQTQLSNLDTSADQAYHFGSVQAEDLAKMKSNLQETERELQDLQSNYDRDKALWEGKVMFLETQKDNYKRDLLESQRKFELTVDQLQKRGTQNKEKAEGNSNAIMKAMEAKYKMQIKEIMETHQALTVDSKNKIKRLETELQTVTEKYASTSQNRFEEVGSLEKRYTETQKNEEKLANELEELRNERNRRVAEYQQQIEKERESFKQRLYESEKKAKEAESKRGSLLFEVEKERANWVLEEDQLKRKISELEEFIQSLELNKENLRKEVDRLRQEIRTGGPSNPAKKQFLFNKPASGSPLVKQAQNVSSQVSQGASKYLLNKSGLLQSHINSSGSVQGGLSYNSQVSTNGSQIPQTNTANNIINAAINRLKESKLQKPAGAATSQHGDTFGPKSLALKQSTSQSSLGAKRREMASPDTHYSQSSSSNVFGASRGSTGNIRVPFGQTSTLGFNIQGQANLALAGVNAQQEGKLILGFARSGSRGASNGRDRYRNVSNGENFDATSQDNSHM